MHNSGVEYTYICPPNKKKRYIFPRNIFPGGSQFYFFFIFFPGKMYLFAPELCTGNGTNTCYTFDT